MRKYTIALTLTGVALTALALAGCSGGSGSTSNSGGSSGSSGSSSTSTSASSDDGDSLSTASSSLGQIVVDGDGMAVYYFGGDKKGESASACTGSCASIWPPVTASATPMVSGVTGTVGTIAGPNGSKQVTIDGMPIYTYSGDKSAGDVKGQLIQNTWWVIAPNGSKITKG